MNPKFLIALVCSAIFLIVGSLFFHGLVGHNDSQNWQVWQGPGGGLEIIDAPGWYFNGFGTVWTYPRILEATYDSPNHDQNSTRRDDSIRVTFNDGGNAQVSSFIRVQLPTTAEQRLQLHKEFNGNPANIAVAVHAHLQNCIKASGPVMSASENQSSRKAEFNQIVEGQLGRGLYQMRRTSIELNDLTELEETAIDAAGNKVTREKKAVVQATEIVRDANGQPIVVEESPLVHYGLVPRQFSIKDIDYDAQTLSQFGAKKESYLNAERSKAQRQEEVQSRLMIEEKGRRQVAEIEAEENQKKTRALIQASQAAEVAVVDKQRAVTDAQRRVEVAAQSQREAETTKAIARIEADTAELRKTAAISLAEAKQKEIQLGGGISEEKRVLAQIEADKQVKVAEALAHVPVPQMVIAGGGSGGGDAMSSLLQVFLFKQLGVLNGGSVISSPPSAQRSNQTGDVPTWSINTAK